MNVLIVFYLVHTKAKSHKTHARRLSKQCALDLHPPTSTPDDATVRWGVERGGGGVWVVQLCSSTVQHPDLPGCIQVGECNYCRGRHLAATTCHNAASGGHPSPGAGATCNACCTTLCAWLVLPNGDECTSTMRSRNPTTDESIHMPLKNLLLSARRP